MTELPPDFADLFACLNEAEVEYMLVGGYAVNVYGYLRATQDLDVWVRPSPENAERLWKALEEFGLPPGLDQDSLAVVDGPPPTGFRFGRPPFAVDLLTSVRGVEFDQAWSRATVRKVGDLSLKVISRADLIVNKRATGRLKDAADVEELERIGEPSD